MATDRREFLKAGIVGGGAAAAGVGPLLAFAGDAQEQTRNLDILVLGGTGFIGPHMVSEALRRGHNVTLFNRGRTNNEIFPDLETIKGDRDGGLDGLRGRQWDVVVDNSGYVPRHVADSARLLAPNVGQYLYISTIAVYADFAARNDEDAPLATIDDETIEEVNGTTYGPLKALCERRVVAEIDADDLTILRPTYIAGPGDHTDRFTWYPVRTRRGGDMLWPGSAAHDFQIIDVRDLANFTIRCVEQKIAGTYNTVTPIGECTFGGLLEDCQALTGESVTPVWIDDESIEATDAWLPIHASKPGPGPAFAFPGERAVAAGMHTRPMRETVRDLLRWWDTLSDERIANARFRMTAEREAELIAAQKSAASG